MATSPIYNWPEPDNTDLVKNGALAMRTLGDAIDTTMATMTPKSIVDAKGDLIAASAADTPARLAVGNNGETLVADSSTATGLRYQGNYAAGKNKIINGDFGIWQRGTSSTTNDTYLADRWRHYWDGTGTFTVNQQTFTAGAAPVAGYEGTYFQRLALNTTGTTSLYQTFTRVEDVRTFAGQTFTLSFWAKANTSTTLNYYVEQFFGSGGSATVTATSGTQSLTTSWQRFSITYTMPSISGKTIGTGSYIQLTFRSTSIASGAYLDFWGMQFEAGSVATAFQTATGTIQGELAACQRYYYRQGGSNVYQHMAFGSAQGTVTLSADIIMPVSMRITPTSVDYANIAAGDGVNPLTAISALSLIANESSPNWAHFNATSTGMTQFRLYNVYANNTANAYIGLSAEL